MNEEMDDLCVYVKISHILKLKEKVNALLNINKQNISKLVKHKQTVFHVFMYWSHLLNIYCTYMYDVPLLFQMSLKKCWEICHLCYFWFGQTVASESILIPSLFIYTTHITFLIDKIAICFHLSSITHNDSVKDWDTFIDIRKYLVCRIMLRNTIWEVLIDLSSLFSIWKFMWYTHIYTNTLNFTVN